MGFTHSAVLEIWLRNLDMMPEEFKSFIEERFDSPLSVTHNWPVEIIPKIGERVILAYDNYQGFVVFDV